MDNIVFTELQTADSAACMEDFLEQEVTADIKNVKKGKAPGGDNITADMLQADEECSVRMLHVLFNKIHEEEICPKDLEKQ